MSRKERPRSIRAYLTRFLLLGAGVLILATALLLDTRINLYLRERFDEDIENRAQALVTLTKVFEEGIELDYAGEFMPEFEEAEGPEYFEIWLPDGSLLERSESLKEITLGLKPRLFSEPEARDFKHPSTGSCRLISMSFVPQEEDADVEGNLDPSEAPDKAVTLFLLRKRDDLDHLLKSVHLLIWGALTVLLGLVVLLVRFALKRGLEPLEIIGGQVRGIDSKALDSRIELKEPVSELEPVVSQLNAMLVRLEKGIRRERRFTSDVAHELRTPLAELRTLSEVASHDPEDVEATAAFFQDVREITLEMQELVANLLELSRCDNGTIDTQREPVNLESVIAKTWKRASAEAERRKITLQQEMGAQPMIQSDERLLDQIFQNLINNAVTYAPVGSVVHIGMQDTRVTLRNPAPNLSEEDTSVMFDRFWQKSSARTGGKNVGLGLSLVHSFCQLLEIGLEAHIEAGNLEITLIFPNINENLMKAG